jgi:VanZ family protein
MAALWWPRPDLPDPPSTLPLDKCVHLGLFASVAWLWMHATRGSLRRRAAWVAGLGLLFAFLSEAGQGLLPFGRAPSLLDGLADAAGLGLGVAAFASGGRVPVSARPRA